MIYHDAGEVIALDYSRIHTHSHKQNSVSRELDLIVLLSANIICYAGTCSKFIDDTEYGVKYIMLVESY